MRPVPETVSNSRDDRRSAIYLSDMNAIHFVNSYRVHIDSSNPLS